MRSRVSILVLGLMFSVLAWGQSQEDDETLSFIPAAKLHEEMQNNRDLYVFDVRTEGEYQRGHIEGSRSLPLDNIVQPRLAVIDGLYRDSAIVTYCGCPHHLSGLAARKLTEIGYSNVRVLEEGFWYWVENKYPVLPAVSEVEVTQLAVSGKLLADNQPVANMDIFLEHQATGQLEATRTDAQGNYAMRFHLYDYQRDDVFHFYVADLGSKPVQAFTPSLAEETDVVVTY